MNPILSYCTKLHKFKVVQPQSVILSQKLGHCCKLPVHCVPGNLLLDTWRRYNLQKQSPSNTRWKKWTLRITEDIVKYAEKTCHFILEDKQMTALCEAPNLLLDDSIWTMDFSGRVCKCRRVLPALCLIQPAPIKSMVGGEHKQRNDILIHCHLCYFFLDQNCCEIIYYQLTSSPAEREFGREINWKKRETHDESVC